MRTWLAVLAAAAAVGGAVDAAAQGCPSRAITMVVPFSAGAYHKAEIEQWWPLIKAAGIKPESRSS